MRNSKNPAAEITRLKMDSRPGHLPREHMGITRTHMNKNIHGKRLSTISHQGNTNQTSATSLRRESAKMAVLMKMCRHAALAHWVGV